MSNKTQLKNKTKNKTQEQKHKQTKNRPLSLKLFESKAKSENVREVEAEFTTKKNDSTISQQLNLRKFEGYRNIKTRNALNSRLPLNTVM